MASNSALFQPIKIGKTQLDHRVVLAPLTRFRSDENHVPTALQQEYYAQRATKGGLLISEATFISPTAGAYPGAPGIYSKMQVEGWKPVTDAVHAKGGVIYLQLWHVGRVTASAILPNNVLPVSASPIAMKGRNMYSKKDNEVPHALTVEEIQSVIKNYAQAAKNAIAAGFDGVEIHGANGYLIDQFTNSCSNKRMDQYGGSIENRTRMALEVVKAVTDAVGAERVGIRLSPWSEANQIYDDTPYDTWGYLVEQLQARHGKMAYIHMVEPRDDFSRRTRNDTANSLDPFRRVWKGTFLSAGGYTTNPQLAAKIADETGNLIVFGRAFIANPDIVERLKNGWPLTKYNRKTFYSQGAVGYTDYPFYDPATSSTKANL
ncbi:12-oxo-phytodienoic acid-like protein [Zychaea mexicana]|uniref:12-oxo-phytodienoic acid-like protein n=1 Tax=Zychaea mexicana TaxID=64656 RepID=UPI0022FE2E54|nr:12-oxo-phytodienoic acid-like protein [Zychaea mexicana]KAI9495763.1 12-oxo-phytodienoic acid-like protein [Zychaea mexicana]